MFIITLWYMYEIVQEGYETLHRVSDIVPAEEIHSERITTIITKMKKALATQYDGVALAAPQIGEAVQIFVVSSKIFDDPDLYPLVYINPQIIYSSPKKKCIDEGCLSCRWKLGQVERSQEVRIRAQNQNGEIFELQADGLLAHIFQHETDHLQGILFLEKAKNVRDMTDEEIREAQG